MKARFPTSLLLALALVLPATTAAAADPYWEPVAQYGDVPGPLWEAGASFSRSGPSSGVVFRFGGQLGTFPNDPLLDEFYAFDLATQTWTNLASNQTPAARADTMMIPGPCGNCVSVVGGRGRFRTGSDHMFPEMWTYHINSGHWEQVEADELGDAFAVRRSSAVMFSVPKRPGHPNKTRSYAFGGVGNTLSGFARTPGGLRNDVTVFDPENGWTLVPTQGVQPVPRAWSTGAYDSTRHALLIFGGYRLGPDQGPSTPPFELFGPTNYANDLWSLDLDTLVWTELQPLGPAPSPRDNVISFFDPRGGGGLVMYGGQAFDGLMTDLWLYSVAENTWTEIALDPGSPVPPARVGGVSFVNETPAAFELYLNGGATSDGGPGLFLDDMWKLTWPKV